MLTVGDLETAGVRIAIGELYVPFHGGHIHL